MRNLKKSERAALEAVAKKFKTTWEERRGSAYLKVARKRVALEVKSLKPCGKAGVGAARPHLRFDGVVVEVMRRLRAAAAKTVPSGMTVVLTLTAPIRLSGKTTDVLETILPTLVRCRPARDVKATLHGNSVRIRVLKGKSRRAPKFIGFVHNPESDPRLLLDLTQESLEFFGGMSGGGTGGRWLVVASPRGAACLEAYLYVFSHLLVLGYEKVLMVFADGSAEFL